MSKCEFVLVGLSVVPGHVPPAIKDAFGTDVELVGAGPGEFTVWVDWDLAGEKER